MSVWLRDSLPSWLSGSKQPCWGSACGQEVRVASGWQPVYHPDKELRAADNHVSLDVDPSPAEPLDEHPSLANTLTEALWKTHLSHDLQKL